jgi:hypothetical protein
MPDAVSVLSLQKIDQYVDFVCGIEVLAAPDLGHGGGDYSVEIPVTGRTRVRLRRIQIIERQVLGTCGGQFALTDGAQTNARVQRLQRDPRRAALECGNQSVQFRDDVGSRLELVQLGNRDIDEAGEAGKPGNAGMIPDALQIFS